MSLHDRIREVVEERLALAQSAIAGQSWWSLPSPADAIRDAEHALGILERHVPVEAYGWGAGHIVCDLEWGAGEGWIATYPCDDIRALATRWRVEVNG